MARYLLVESRDPFTSTTTHKNLDVARALAAKGHDVTVFLVENGVLAARRSPASAALTDLGKAGVTVLADEFALRERGIGGDRLCEGVRASGLDLVVDQLGDGAKTIWH